MDSIARLAIVGWLCLRIAASAGGAVYYLDTGGDDDNGAGTSAHAAWKSLARLDGVELKPGDKILLKAGCRFVGRLRLKGSGSEGKPIVIDRYGGGADPVVAGEGKVENTIRLHNQHHWEIRNLVVTNTDGGGWDDKGRAIRRAIYVTAEDAGDVEHIHLRDLEIRDVRGMYRFKGNQTNGGIICQVTGKNEAPAPQFQKANMHLCPKGKWALGEDRWGKIVRVNMLKITPADWTKVPGVKKAWPMKGYEGVAGMAFHPVLSDVKDVDGDGKPDIFRCRSEHPGARIERLRYDDGSVVWESQPLGAMFGDETRLPVFDLHGSGIFSVLYASRHATCGKLVCLRADTGKTEWSASYGDGAIKNHGNGQGDVVVGHFLDRQKQSVVVRDGGILRCYDHAGKKVWTHDTKLRGGAAYAHEIMRCDVDGDGQDEIFANWQKLTMGLRGDGTVLWEDRTQKHHSDFVDYGDVDADGKAEVVYDHEGCDAARGPIYVVEPLTGKVKTRIDYRKQGVRHAQNIALGNFDKSRKGLEIAFCEKGRNLYLFDAGGKLIWKRPVPASLLSKGDWDGDGEDDILAFGLGANVDGIFSVWGGDGKRLYAISFLPSPHNRMPDESIYKKNPGGSWRAHAMPGGHEGVRRQTDLDGNGRADVIMPFGEWHWGSDSILFLMECPSGVGGRHPQ